MAGRRATPVGHIKTAWTEGQFGDPEKPDGGAGGFCQARALQGLVTEDACELAPRLRKDALDRSEPPRGPGGPNHLRQSDQSFGVACASRRERGVASPRLTKFPGPPFGEPPQKKGGLRSSFFPTTSKIVLDNFKIRVFIFNAGY